MGQHNRRLGAWGEAKAARWYEARGYRVVDQNWRHSNKGELDLVVRQGNRLVFCEVKTRSSTRFGTPLDAITETKAHRVRLVAAAWREAHGVDGLPCRYDVAAIVAGTIKVYEGVL